jgi:outer membrane protein OmpA-like peptidoglycan-associated protein
MTNLETNKKFTLVTLAALALGIGACAGQPTPHLVEARDAYDDARTGYVNEHAPDAVYEAKVALDAAEKAHDRNPGSEKEKHLAYVAHRKAMLAVQAAKAKMAAMEQEKADTAKEEILLSQRDRSRGALEETQGDLEQTKEQLSAEKEARTAAENTAAAALASLDEIASIKAEEERVVITLSGSVLFKTDEATLLPIARDRLDKVAEVLQAEGDGKKIVIAGHTDSRGAAGYNDDLSRRRAEAVRTYLVSKGVAGDMVEAVGMGENEPIADNTSAEGRANNRRVEIIIDESGATRTSRR